MSSRAFTRPVLAILVALAFAAASCGDDGGNDPAASEPTAATDDGDGATANGDDTETSGTGGCDSVAPDGHLEVELSGAVTESVDWAADDMDCSGVGGDGLLLGWTQGDLDFLLEVDVDEGQTGEGLAGDLVINAGDTSYATTERACTVEITSYERESELALFVEGSGTCAEATEIGGEGTVTVGPLTFTGYALPA